MTFTESPLPGISLLPPVAVWALATIVVFIAVCAVALLLRAPPRALPTVAPMAALAACAGVSAALGFDPRAGLLFTALFAAAVIWHAAIVRFFDDPGVARAIYAAILVSGTLASLAAIVMVVSRQPTALYVVAHGRAVGTFIVPGELAGYLIVFVPLAFALARAGPAELRRPAYVAFATGTIAFVLTFSRAGWLGMAAALACFVTLTGRAGAARTAFAIIGAAILAVGVVFNAHHDPSENFTRLSIWGAALQVIERFPLLGVGPSAFARIYPVLRFPDGEPFAFHAHSLVLTLAAELGIAGLAAACYAWWQFGRTFAARLTRAPQRPVVALAIVAGLAGLFVQSLIDTVSVAVLALWPAFSALALAAAGTPASPRPATQSAGAPRAFVFAIPVVAIVAGLALIQLASAAVYGFAAAPWSVPVHLSERAGLAMYARIERVAPFAFVEATLAAGALRNGDPRAAQTYAARLPPGPVRDELFARAARASGREEAAIDAWLSAGDDEALQAAVEALVGAHDDAAAYRLERRIRDRFANVPTRPNALADSSWRLARLAWRLGRRSEALSEMRRATVVAPLNTKYLVDLGQLSLQAGDDAGASDAFRRAVEIDPRLRSRLDGKLRAGR